MTDNEIVKALECCANELGCKNCPENPHKGNYGFCTDPLIKGAFNLINRQKAEIERLKGWQDLLKAEKHSLIKAEAIKEFAERLKKYSTYSSDLSMLVIHYWRIDDLVKEMVGEGNGQ